MIDVVNTLSSFLPMQTATPELPDDQILIISKSQLKALIAEIVTEAIQSLKNDISRAKADLNQSDEIARLKASQETLEFHLSKQIAEDRRRITALEDQPRTSPDPTKKTTDHLDELARLMSEDKTQQVSIAKAARLLRLSKERMRQLKPLISRDSRFELAWDRLHGQPKHVVIRLKQYIRANDRHTKFGIGIAD